MISPIQEIKEKLDIVDFLRGYLYLTPAGKNFKALCPFHKEKTPSFMVSPERQSWHCFGACNEGGDIFKFLMKYENLEFYEALKILAERVGVDLKRSNPIEQKKYGILYDIVHAAKDFYKKQLKEASDVLGYLQERGLKKEVIEEFELGFAPDNFEALILDLLNLGYSPQDMERAGLVIKNDRNRYVDRFRNRLMFPIYNSFGKVVGFSGRILPWAKTIIDIGKYINSPETPIFNKSRILYGFHKTKDYIKNEKGAILVEGQMDFLSLYGVGVRNVVAISGTALTQDHLRILSRFTDKLFFFFDNDEAGFRAAERSFDLALAADFNVQLLMLEGYKDPAELIEKNPSQVKEILSRPLSVVEFYFKKYLFDQTGNISNFKNNLRQVLGKIKILASSIERAYWLKELSLRLNIKEQVLWEEMEKLQGVVRDRNDIIPKKKIDNDQSSRGTVSLSRREIIAEKILSILMAKSSFVEEIKKYVDYFPLNYLPIFDSLCENKDLEEGHLVERFNLLALRSSLEVELLGEENLERELKHLLVQMRIEALKEERERLASLVKEYEKKGQEEKLKEVLVRFDEISKMIHN